MNNLVRIFVDEPESCITLSNADRNRFKRLLPTMIDWVVFSVFNELFLCDANEALDIEKVARLLYMNILMINSHRGLTYDGSSETLLTRPLEEFLTCLIPALTKLGKFSLLTQVIVTGEQTEIFIQNNN